MTKLIRSLILSVTIVSVLASCNFGRIPTVELTIRETSTGPYAAGQLIKYSYTIRNTGAVPLPVPPSVTSDKSAVICPSNNAKGIIITSLIQNDEMVCTSEYLIKTTDGNLVTNTATVNNTISSGLPLTVQVGTNTASAQSPLTLTTAANPPTYSKEGDLITFSYQITYNGPAIASPVQFQVTDTLLNPQTFPCGAQFPNLPQTPQTLTVTCIAPSTYKITLTDMGAVSVANLASASYSGGPVSQKMSVPVSNTTRSNPALTLITTANPATYSKEGDLITFSYVITYNGPAIASPVQFQVTDTLLNPQTFNCGIPTTLPPSTPVTCFAPSTYRITPADMGAGVVSVANLASASYSGGPVSQKVSVPVTKSGVVQQNQNLTPGSTIQHTVVKGEWLIQIARCYGADYNEVRIANPHILVPAYITPGMTVTVRNIGSKGKIYGLPCIGFHTFQSGDTWPSIAQKYNADILVLQEANRNVSLANGACIRVPMNSAGGTIASPPTGSGSCNTGTNSIPPQTNIRITIPVNQTSVTLPGTVLASGKVRYVFTATQGQSLTVRLLNSPANELTMGITASNGSIMKTQDATLTFTGTIPSTGDSFIDIFAVSGASSKTYSLEVTITTPASASPLQLAADINPGTGNSNPAYLTVYNGVLYFSADDGKGAGKELWKFDSTKTIDASNPSLVANIAPGPIGSSPEYLAVYKNALYFSADDGKGTTGRELWKYDPAKPVDLTNTDLSKLNPSLVADTIRLPVSASSEPKYLTEYNGFLYFQANNGDHGAQLWKYDGTSITGAAHINQITSNGANPAFLTVYKGALYFGADDGNGKGQELWKCVGTPCTSVMFVDDINKTGTNGSNPSKPEHLAVDKKNDADPTNDMLYFSADDGTGKGVELWRYDGSIASLAFDFRSGPDSSFPRFLTEYGGAMYLQVEGTSGTIPNAGPELWRYDGTNPSIVADIWPGQISSVPSFLTEYGGWLYFSADDGKGKGVELWRYKP